MRVYACPHCKSAYIEMDDLQARAACKACGWSGPASSLLVSTNNIDTADIVNTMARDMADALVPALPGLVQLLQMYGFVQPGDKAAQSKQVDKYLSAINRGLSYALLLVAQEEEKDNGKIRG